MSIPAQLQMIWPESLLNSPPKVNLPDDYGLRTYKAGDNAGYIKLMTEAGFPTFTETELNKYLQRVLPNGLFLVVHKPTDRLVATTMATHFPSELHPFGGELGWVAGSPDHSGKGLGKAVCAAVVARFLKAGYERIYLKTDDCRLPAIKIYLQLGFTPFLFSEDMKDRWDKIISTILKTSK